MLPPNLKLAPQMLICFALRCFNVSSIKANWNLGPRGQQQSTLVCSMLEVPFAKETNYELKNELEMKL